jgi:hypothetical protein
MLPSYRRPANPPEKSHPGMRANALPDCDFTWLPELFCRPTRPSTGNHKILCQGCEIISAGRVVSRVSLWKKYANKIDVFSKAYKCQFRQFPPGLPGRGGPGRFSAQYNILYAEKWHKIRTVCSPTRSHAGKSRVARAGTCVSFTRSDIAPHRGCFP